MPLGAVFILVSEAARTLDISKECRGETCRWHVARQPSDGNCVANREVAGLPEAGQVPLQYTQKLEREVAGSLKARQVPSDRPKHNILNHCRQHHCMVSFSIMFETISPRTNPGLLRHLKIGRETLAATRARDARRLATFAVHFEFSAPEGKEAYLFGQFPIVQPEATSPLAGVLLDGLADGTIVLDAGTIAAQRPRLTGQAERALRGDAITVGIRIAHQRPFGHQTVPGELDGWFIGTMHATSLTYGSGVHMLLQPGQVELTQPSQPQA